MSYVLGLAQFRPATRWHNIFNCVPDDTMSGRLRQSAERHSGTMISDYNEGDSRHPGFFPSVSIEVHREWQNRKPHQL